MAVFSAGVLIYCTCSLRRSDCTEYRQTGRPAGFLCYVLPLLAGAVRCATIVGHLLCCACYALTSSPADQIYNFTGPTLCRKQTTTRLVGATSTHSRDEKPWWCPRLCLYEGFVIGGRLRRPTDGRSLLVRDCQPASTRLCVLLPTPMDHRTRMTDLPTTASRAAESNSSPKRTANNRRPGNVAGNCTMITYPRQDDPIRSSKTYSLM